MERIIEKWQDKICEVVLGSTKADGGSRGRTIKIGGETGVYFIKGEDACPNPPVIAMEVWDMEPGTWPDSLKANFGSSLKDPAEWAKMCVDKFSADLICLRLASVHPDLKNASPEEAGKIVEKILKAVAVPLVVIGSSSPEKDNEVMVHCADVAKGENCLFGIATQENYKTLTAACLYRVAVGKTIFDRIIAAGLVGTNGFILLTLIGFLFGRRSHTVLERGCKERAWTHGLAHRVGDRSRLLGVAPSLRRLANLPPLG